MRVIKIKPITDATGSWDEDENSLYEDLYCSKYDCSYKELFERWSKEPFNVGDIIMVNSSGKSSTGSNFVTPHRVFIISSVSDEGNNQKYLGYELSSNVSKSNKYILNSDRIPVKDWWKSNIYIKNYSTILQDGVPSDREAMIDLGTLYEFSNDNLSANGVKKGVASKEFSDFVFDTVNKIYRNEDVSGITWEK